jgi:hypothetical protein
MCETQHSAIRPSSNVARTDRTFTTNVRDSYRPHALSTAAFGRREARGAFGKERR